MQLNRHLTVRTIAFLSFITTARSLTIHNNASIILGKPANSIVHATNPISSHSLKETRVLCDSDIYGQGLVENSCIDAYDTIPEDWEWVSFGARGGPFQWYIDLPHRWISNDGRCVFDIYTVNDRIVDVARLIDFKMAAFGLINTCISPAGSPRKGGIATNIGRHGLLSLIMTAFEPTVRCSDPPGEGRGPEECYEILSKMPASKTRQRFGRSGDSGVEVSLPTEIASDDRTCVATIDTTGEPADANWFRIWEQMVAVEGMCTLNDMEGAAFALGSRRNIFVSMRRGTPTIATTS